MQLLAEIILSFDFACLIAVGVLYKITPMPYKLIPALLLVEFVAHQVVYGVGLKWLGILDRTSIYIAYMAIQVSVLALMYRYKIYSGITILLLANLIYNFVTVLYHFYYTSINFHAGYKYAVGAIMILEILYLIGIQRYGANNGRNKRDVSANNNSNFLFLGSKFHSRNSGGEMA